MALKVAVVASVQVNVHFAFSGERREWGVKGLHMVGTVRQEPVVKVDEVNKPLQLAFRLGLGEILDGLNFLGEWGDAMSVDMIAKKIQLRYAKEALVWVDHDTVC